MSKKIIVPNSYASFKRGFINALTKEVKSNNLLKELNASKLKKDLSEILYNKTSIDTKLRSLYSEFLKNVEVYKLYTPSDKAIHLEMSFIPQHIKSVENILVEETKLQKQKQSGVITCPVFCFQSKESYETFLSYCREDPEFVQTQEDAFSAYGSKYQTFKYKDINLFVSEHNSFFYESVQIFGNTVMFKYNDRSVVVYDLDKNNIKDGFNCIGCLRIFQLNNKTINYLVNNLQTEKPSAFLLNENLDKICQLRIPNKKFDDVNILAEQMQPIAEIVTTSREIKQSPELFANLSAECFKKEYKPELKECLKNLKEGLKEKVGSVVSEEDILFAQETLTMVTEKCASAKKELKIKLKIEKQDKNNKKNYEKIISRG